MMCPRQIILHSHGMKLSLQPNQVWNSVSLLLSFYASRIWQRFSAFLCGIFFTDKTVWSVWYRRTCFNLQDCETYFVFENAYRVYNFHNPFLFSSCWESHLFRRVFIISESNPMYVCVFRIQFHWVQSDLLSGKYAWNSSLSEGEVFSFLMPH